MIIFKHQFSDDRARIYPYYNGRYGVDASLFDKPIEGDIIQVLLNEAYNMAVKIGCHFEAVLYKKSGRYRASLNMVFKAFQVTDNSVSVTDVKYKHQRIDKILYDFDRDVLYYMPDGVDDASLIIPLLQYEEVFSHLFDEFSTSGFCRNDGINRLYCSHRRLASC